MHGQFVWYELTTPDVDAATRFYPRFTGWGTQAFDKNYMMWTHDGLPIGGVFRLNDEMRARGVPPNWMVYVEVSNVDESARKAESLGGRIVAGPDDIPGTGRFAVVQDPQGATFGIYKSINQSIAWDGTPVAGRFSWHELMTTDYRKAFEFYEAVFGWEKTGEMDMGGGMMYLLFGKGGEQYGGMYDRTPDMAGMPPFWLMYVHVKDVAKAVTTATQNGAFVHRPQMEIPGGTIAILGDPQGAGFAVHDTKTMAVATAAATVAKAGVALKKAVRKAVKAVKKAAKKVRKSPALKKASARAKAKAKPVARKAKAVARKARARVKTKARTMRKAVAKKSARKPAPRKTRRTTRARAKK
jgi:hypothetical protein